MEYTHYDYLELAPGASRARIEAAYAALLARFQLGDAGPNQDMAQLVRMVHAAYQVLSDPAQRRVYDAHLEHDAAEADAELKSLLDAQAYVPKRVQDAPAALLKAVAKIAA
ncbi:MAG TPA: DnaJ domain-containing protein [Casimicrobiaceae bacterium]|nr:DnaJ domain-containing protein [Casimicrobiaceae bacterium]